MMKRVLDTSVACAWYLPEAFSETARIWHRKMVDGEVQLLVPALHALEFGNVLRTYVRRGEIAADLAKDIYATHLEAPLQWEEPARHSLLELAMSYETTTYDAAYISLALQYSAPILTAERTTTPWVVKLGKLVEAIRP